MNIIWKNKDFLIVKGTDRYDRSCLWIHLANGTRTDKYFYTLEKATKKCTGWSTTGTGPARPTLSWKPAKADVVVGMLSDTHDQKALISAAAHCFLDQGCTAVLHGGDFQTADSLWLLVEELDDGVPVYWVTGNHDDWADAPDLPGQRLSAAGEEYGSVELSGFHIGLAHGTYGRNSQWSQRTLRGWVESGEFDLLMYGHFHQFNVRFPDSAANTLVVDPGGFYQRASKEWSPPRTIAVANLTQRTLEPLVWNEADTGFEPVGIIDLDTREFEAGAGFDTWQVECDPWAARDHEHPENWASASKHIDPNMDAWISHLSLSEGDGQV